MELKLQAVWNILMGLASYTHKNLVMRGIELHVLIMPPQPTLHDHWTKYHDALVIYMLKFGVSKYMYKQWLIFHVSYMKHCDRHFSYKWIIDTCKWHRLSKVACMCLLWGGGGSHPVGFFNNFFSLQKNLVFFCCYNF